jgi:hypothetical protein
MKPNAVVVADRPLGTAISRALHVLSVSSVAFPFKMIHDMAGNNNSWNWPISPQSAKDAFFNCELVLTVDSDRRGPADVVALVHLLRWRWLGDARFVALLHSDSERTQLVECDLFGDPGRAFAFGNIAGHSARLFPLKLVELFQEIQFASLATERMTAASWMIECADQASALKVMRNLKILRSTDWKHNSDGALAQARELVRNLHAAKWDAQLFPKDHHTGPELARGLLEEFPASRQLKVDDLMVICEKTERILNMSVFACLNQQTT